MKNLQSTEDMASKPATLLQAEKTTETTDSPNGHNGHLTSGRLLARNTIWNLLGNGAPMLVAVFSIRILIQGLGKERFGVLTLAWALIGYASLFDLGLGRALTQLVAKKLGAGEDSEVPTLVWTSLILMLVLGLAGALVAVLLSPWLVHRALNVPVALQGETLRSFYLLGLSIPVVISTAGLRGLLEAHQRFGLINAMRIPMSVYSFASPLLVLPFSRSLFPVVTVLVVGRVIGWAAHLWVCLRVAPELRDRIAWHRPAVGPLLRFGGWMTVTNVVSPLMVTLDRFLIGALVSMTAVAYYATPYEVVTKLWLIPAALVPVMFPAFSASFEHDRSRTAVLYSRCVKYIFLALFPVVLLAVGLAQFGLTLWLGADFAQHSFRVLQWLAVGVLFNSLAQVPFALVQGAGRPDMTAKLHMAELPFYLLALWWLISSYGVEGAAIAWTVRVGVDALILFVMAKRSLPGTALMTGRVTLMSVAALLSLTLAAIPHSLLARALFVLVAILGFAFVSWFFILSPEERTLALDYL
jgi:O-antigen/teichoic acid export membrane protein